MSRTLSSLCAVSLLLVPALTACSYRSAPSTGEVDTSTTTTAPPAPLLAGFTIVLDAGHNGGNAAHPEIVDELVDAVTADKPCDTTGTETDDGYAEHAFNFDVTERLAAELRDAGATVVTTRDSDDGVGPCITQRAAIGNDAAADAAVSIHADGGPADGRGFHVLEPVLIDGRTEDIVEPSHRLAGSIADAYRTGTTIPASDYIGTNGINPRDDMAGLNLSTVPKVMVECGNMRNATDAEILSDADSRQIIADALAAGITAFLLD